MRGAEVRGVVEHVGLEPADGRGRVDPELVEQRRPQPAQRGQGVGLPVAAVLGQREGRPQPLPERVVRDERRELVGDDVVAADVEQGLGAGLQQAQVDGVEPVDLLGDARQVGDPGVRPPPPQGEGLLGEGEPVGRGGGRVGGGDGQALEPAGVDGVVGQAQPVPVGGARQVLRGCAGGAVGLEQRAQPGHGHLQRRGGLRRRRLAPERVDQLLGADGPAGGGEQDGEDGPLAAGGHDGGGALHVDGQLTQHLQLGPAHATSGADAKAAGAPVGGR